MDRSPDDQPQLPGIVDGTRRGRLDAAFGLAARAVGRLAGVKVAGRGSRRVVEGVARDLEDAARALRDLIGP